MQGHGWIRYACACGYTQETICTGRPEDNARPCGLCGSTVVGERFALHDPQQKAA
jgi:hypothetical protein